MTRTPAPRPRHAVAARRCSKHFSGVALGLPQSDPGNLAVGAPGGLPLRSFLLSILLSFLLLNRSVVHECTDG